MPNAADILWFKQNFQSDIQTGIAGTNFTVDFMVALACQETGDVWPVLRKKPGLSVQRIVELCVGDTLDSDRGRKAFPKTRADLESKSNGTQMFQVARQALVDMAQHVPGFPVSNPNKFCHGFGVFQYDLQFFLDDPDYFLQKKYEKFSGTLGKALEELRSAAKKVHLDAKPALTDMELCTVAIAYNTGGFNPAKGLKQGHFDGTRFYGEQIHDFIALSRTVVVPGGGGASGPGAGGGNANAGTGAAASLKVATQGDALRLRSAPQISIPSTANVIAQLPNGQLVRAVTGTPVNNFLEIETSLSGANIRGFASKDFLKPA